MLIKTFIASKNNGKYAVSARDETLRNKFNSFIKEEFTTAQNDYTHDNVIDKFVAGSDQVWQLSVPGLHPTFFLRFCSQEKRVAYAASFGTTTIHDYNKKKLIKYLSEIPFISVREDVALEVIHNVLPDREDVVQTLDPVLMHDTDWWRREESEISNIHSKYIICYFLGDPSEYRSQIDRIIESYSEDIKVYWVSTGYEMPRSDEFIYMPSPREFIYLIDKALYVLTDSLHGMEFAILFHKEFMACERHYITEAEQSSRVTSLLNMLSLDYIKIKNSKEKISEKIDYKIVDSILDCKRNLSNDFLLKALGF